MGRFGKAIVSHLQGKGRLRLIQQHRFYQYEKALDKLMDGKVSPEYVKERADKVKSVRL